IRTSWTTLTRKCLWRFSRRAIRMSPDVRWNRGCSRLRAISRRTMCGAAGRARVGKSWSICSPSALNTTIHRARRTLSSPPDLGEALAKLPRAQREAFAMLKLEGLSLEGAAERAGVSVGALKVRAHRAYKALRKLISG